MFGKHIRFLARRPPLCQRRAAPSSLRYAPAHPTSGHNPLWPTGDRVWILNKNRSICGVRGAKAPTSMHGTVHLFDRLPQVTRPAAPLSGAAAPVRSIPLVGVIRNLRSHRQAASLPEWSGRANLLVETPETRGELQAI